MKRLVIIIVLFSAVTAFGQIPGDFNCDELVLPSDLIYIINLWSFYCDNLMECTIENGDHNNDGIPLTASDYLSLWYYFRGITPPDYARHPESDTLLIELAYASPGDNLILPVYLTTVDTLTTVQFYIASDDDYITIDSVLFALDLQSHQIICWGTFQVMTFVDINTTSFLPGEYLLANVYVTVNPDITQPVTTYIEFTENIDYALYTGLGNMSFFQPVLVDAEITITPTGIDDYTDTGLPSKISITAYPNPFNSSVNITAITDSDSELVIYDLLGREIKSYPVNAGENSIVWEATDENGLAVNSGIYFVKLSGASGSSVEKVVYLK